MNDTLLFSLDDVRTHKKDVSANIKDFDDYAKITQENYLRKLLTSSLYNELLSFTYLSGIETISGSYITGNGVEEVDSDAVYTDYFDVSLIENLHYSGTYGVDVAAVVFYDNFYNVVSSITTDSTTEVDNLVIEVPFNAVYARGSSGSGDPLTFNDTSTSAGVKFYKLLNGSKYNSGGEVRFFSGIKKYCSFVWLFLFSKLDGIQSTDVGNVLFKDSANYSRKEGSSFMREAAKMYESIANNEEESILDFIENSSIEFTEFDSGSEVKEIENTDIQFKPIEPRVQLNIPIK